MTYKCCIPNVSQTEGSHATRGADPTAALSFAGWSEAEARRRVVALLRTGWSARQLALTFGVPVEEIDRLVGIHDQPMTQIVREMR